MHPFRLAGAAAGLVLAVSLVPALVPGFVQRVAAQMPPAGRLFGFIQVDDHGAYDGTPVVAHVGDSSCGQTLYNGVRGLYIVDLDSSNAECNQPGATVWFTVGGCTAYNTGNVPDLSGALRVDLTAPGTC